MRVDNSTGICNLCAVALHLRQTMPKNAATQVCDSHGAA